MRSTYFETSIFLLQKYNYNMNFKKDQKSRFFGEKMHLDKSLSFKENYMNDKLWVKHGVTYNFKQNNEL